MKRETLIRQNFIAVLFLLCFLFCVQAFAALDDERESAADSTPPIIELSRTQSKNKILVGIVEKYTGVGWIRRSGGGSRERVVHASKVYQGDFIETEVGRVRLKTRHGGVIEIGTRSAIAIEEIVVHKPNSLTPLDQRGPEVEEMRTRFLNGIVHIQYLSEPPLRREKLTLKTMSAMVQVDGPYDLFLFQPENEQNLNLHMLRGTATITSIVTNDHMVLSERSGGSLRSTGMVVGLGAVSDDLRRALEAQVQQ